MTAFHTHKRGDTYRGRIWAFRDSEGDWLDLTGRTYRLQFKDSPNSQTAAWEVPLENGRGLRTIDGDGREVTYTDSAGDEQTLTLDAEGFPYIIEFEFVIPPLPRGNWHWDLQEIIAADTDYLGNPTVTTYDSGVWEIEQDVTR